VSHVLSETAKAIQRTLTSGSTAQKSNILSSLKPTGTIGGVAVSSIIAGVKTATSNNNAPSVKLAPSSTPGTKTLTGAGQTWTVPAAGSALGPGDLRPMPSPAMTPTQAMIQNLTKGSAGSPLAPALAIQNAGLSPVMNFNQGVVKVLKSAEQWIAKNPWAATGLAALAGGAAGFGVSKLKARTNPDGSVTITKRRSTNYSNPKALRRSLSRVSGFNRLVKSVNKTMRHAVPR